MSSLHVRICAVFAALGSAVAVAQVPAPPVSPAPTVRLEYDAVGNSRRTILAPGTLNLGTSHEYDRLQRRFKTTDAHGKDAVFGYNGREDLTSVTDPRSLVTQYQRNGLGDVSNVVSPDTGVASQTFDAKGNLVMRLDSRGVLATHAYDPLNRLLSITYTQSGQSPLVLMWNYDQTGAGFSNGVGRLTSTQFPGGSATYAYDPKGRMVATTQTLLIDEGPVVLTTGYGYDAAGRVVSITYPSGRVLYITHTAGVPTAMSLAPSPGAPAIALLSGLQFQPMPGGYGAARSWHWHLDTGTQPNERVFDVYGRMVRHPLGGAVRDITYDAADRITSYTHHNAISGAPVTSLDQAFGYDQLDRLTSVSTGVGSWTYAYDDNGNRTAVSLTAGSATSSRSHTIAGSSNRLLSLTNPSRTFTHDAAGNTVVDHEGAMTWRGSHDLRGRLVETGATTNGSSFLLSRYLHDNAERRVYKESYAREICTAPPLCATTPLWPPIATVFVYDQEGRLLGEYSANGSVRREYVWLQGMPVVIIDGTPSAQSVAFVQTDHLDTPRTVIDRVQGRQRWTWMAEPFGNSAPLDNPVGFGKFELNLRMPGQYHDSETGLVYNWNRSYVPSLGRYTQSDPIGLAGGINTYTYVGGSPVNLTDEDGLRPRSERPTVRPNPAVDAAGYHDIRVKTICLEWNCPNRPDACSRDDTKKPGDFMPAAFNPAAGPKGCKCSRARYVPDWSPPNKVNDETALAEAYNRYREYNDFRSEFWRRAGDVRQPLPIWHQIGVGVRPR